MINGLILLAIVIAVAGTWYVFNLEELRDEDLRQRRDAAARAAGREELGSVPAAARTSWQAHAACATDATGAGTGHIEDRAVRTRTGKRPAGGVAVAASVAPASPPLPRTRPRPRHLRLLRPVTEPPQPQSQPADIVYDWARDGS